MTAAGLLAEVESRGVRLTTDGRRLTVKGPRSVVTEFRPALETQKPDLMRLLQSRPPEQHPTILHVLEVLDARVVHIRPADASPYRPAPRMPALLRPDMPARGARVRLAMVELPAFQHGYKPEANENERQRWRRDHRARQCWRIERLDGAPTGIGLFVGVDEATAYGRSRGWSLAT